MIQEKVEEKVCINITPCDNMSKVVHLTTTAMSNYAGLNLDQTDDLNTALDELIESFNSISDGKLSFCVNYVIHRDRLEIRAEGLPIDLSNKKKEITRYSRFVLDSMTDEIREYPNPNGGCDIVMIKYITT